MKKRIGILTGGGDVQPLNAVLAAAKNAAIGANVELLGFLKGWEGALRSQYVSLKPISINPMIGGTILKSSRVNLAFVPGGPDTVLSNFKKIGLSGLIVVGGEDTLSNSLALEDFPQVLISKTIDNDVGILPTDREKLDIRKIVNYFTLGYPTAGTHISKFVSLPFGLRSTAYSHERIIVVESMGMHAGWLALASSMGKPDFIIIPEFPLNFDEFKELVDRRFASQKHVIVVVAEGARWNDGSHISADEKERDEFGHPRFKGSAAVLATRLKEDRKHRYDSRNVNSVNPSYLYRSGAPEPLDLQFGKKLGRKAVQVLQKGMDGSVLLAIQRRNHGFVVDSMSIKGIRNIESLHRFVDSSFYSSKDYGATKQGAGYLRHIFKEINDVHYKLITKPESKRL